ncbi:MAG TPA: hypothetical protein VE981_06240, partial [Planctomycetota bacterium]|nr:hypothetical protein [Planctomycetota bacterium]
TGAFTHVLGPGSQYFNDETTGLCLSSDGRYLAFATAATNTGFTPNGNAQIYLCDFGPGRNQSTLTLVSHAMGSSTVGCDNVCYLEQHGISADGEVVVFDGLASDLTGTDGDGQPDIYYWRRSTGVVAIASVPSGSGSLSYGAAVSGDGTTIGYVRQDVSQAPFPRYVNCELYTIATGLRRRISPDNVHVALSWPVCLSFDGSKVLYVQDDSPTMPLLLYIEGQGTRPAVASTTGDVPLVPVSYFTFSGDGRWIGFATLATNMVPDDTNGFYDVFIRGPQ